MSTKIQLRRGIAAAWTAANPVLAIGELGLESDTKKLKQGDGATAWNALAYFGKSQVGLPNVDNTADLDKPVSNEQAAINAAKADLVGGKVPAGQLPSYVDDVLEYANLAAFPGPGESGKIYTALDTKKIYRWSGSTYVELDPMTIPNASQVPNDSGVAGATVKDALDTLAGISSVITAQRSIGKTIAGSPAAPASQTNPISNESTNDGDTFVVTVGSQTVTFENDQNNDGLNSVTNVPLNASGNGTQNLAPALAAGIRDNFPTVLTANWDPAMNLFTVNTIATGSAASFSITCPGGFAMAASGADAIEATGATYRKLLNAPGAGKQWRVLTARVLPGNLANQWTTAGLALVVKEGGGTLHPIAFLDAHAVSLGGGTPGYSYDLPRPTTQADYDAGVDNCEIGIATVDPSAPSALLAEPIGDDLKVIVDAVKTDFPNLELS